jgi:hypothetical protein
MAQRSLIASAAFNPVAILGQFLLAGLSLFHDADLWVGHGILGSAVALPVGIIAVTTCTDRRALHLRFWALAQATVYVTQVGLILVGQSSGSGVLQALHAVNGALLLLISFILAQKTNLLPKSALPR